MRIERIGDATLYLGDCLEILPTLPKVDAVITDPPYGVRADAWDDMTAREFAEFSMRWLVHAKALSQELIAFGYAGNALHRLCEMVYPRVRLMFWNKPMGSQMSGATERNRWFASEAIFHCYEETPPAVQAKELRVAETIRSARELAGLSRSGVDILVRGKKTGLCYRWEEGACLPTPEQVVVLKRNLPLSNEFDEAMNAAIAAKQEVAERLVLRQADKTDVLTYRTVNEGRHPCEKPVPLMLDLIQFSGASYRSILDPFLGSGSTGVAATQAGATFTGIERETKYFDIACRRIEQAYKQRPLFEAEPPKKAEQLEIDA